MIIRPPLQLDSKEAWTDREVVWQRHQRQILFQQATLVWSQRSDREQRGVWQRDFLLFKEVVLELRATPPLGITFDLFALWRQGFQFVPRSISPSERALTRLFLRIQNEVYHRLLRMPVFQQRHRQWLNLASSSTRSSIPTQTRDESNPSGLSLAEKALVVLTTALLRPVADLLLDSFRPHELFAPHEDIASSPVWCIDPWGCIERFEANIADTGWLQAYHDAWVDAWIRIPALENSLVAQESMMLHIERIHSPLQRVQWEQLHRILQEIPPASNLHRFVMLRELGYQTWKLSSSHFRAEGGYSGLSRRGEWESLLPAEWLFWDETFSPNPFWVRWAEQESLFYEREETESLTRHRHLSFVLDLDPGEARYKNPTMSAPGYTLVLALLARICLDLRNIGSTEALSFSFHLGPADLWKMDIPLLALFFETLPHIGANTRFLSLLSMQELSKHWHRKPVQVIYIATRNRWNQHTPIKSLPGQPLCCLVGTDVSDVSDPSVFRLDWEQEGSSTENLVFFQERMLEWILSTPVTEGQP